MDFRFGLTVRHWILAVTLAALTTMALPPARQLFEQHNRITADEEKLEALLTANARLEARIARLKDPQYVEKLAREQLEMVRPGEVSYVVVPVGAAKKEAVEEPRPPEWYQRLWEWFKSHS